MNNLKTILISQDDDGAMVECVLQTETPKALCVVSVDDNDVWLPKSQVEVTDKFPVENDAGKILAKKVVVHVPTWLLEDKNLV